MNKFKISILTILAAMLLPCFQLRALASSGSEDGKLDVKEVIFHHLGDGYGWEVPFSHVYRIPLPVIVRAEDGQWFCFSSAKLTEVTVTEVVEGKEKGKKHESLEHVIYTTERNGKQYSFLIPEKSENASKVVQVFPLDATENAQVEKLVAEKNAVVKAEALKKGIAFKEDSAPKLKGYAWFDGQYYREYRTFDLSITKNVLALFISALIVFLLVMWLVKFYGRKGMTAPRKGLGFMELLVSFIYTGVIKQTLGKKADHFAPYLLTCFFFILIMNLLGLIVIFPGGANLTGNIAITLVLAILTFIVTNIHGNKHYWKEIFWPDVPMFLKFPLPIMQVIEIFGMFTKPAALCVRLFANMMGGHMIVLTLTVLIFIFAVFGAAAKGGSVVVSLLFSIFMLLLDILVSFIQAYVFTMLSTIFISMAVEDHDGHEHKGEHADETVPSVEA